MGTVAYTFDELAHAGVHKGVHYAMGYCGSGVSMASYLGMRTGQKVLGLPEGRTAFDNLPFPARPLYTGSPWFCRLWWPGTDGATANNTKGRKLRPDRSIRVGFRRTARVKQHGET